MRLKEKPIPPTAIHDNAQPSTSSQQVTLPNESFELTSDANEEDSFVESLIYESDNSGNVSQDPLELAPNESIGSMEFQGFDDIPTANANGNNEDSVVQNTQSSTNQQRMSTESDENSTSNNAESRSIEAANSAPQDLVVADADSASNDAENQSIDVTSKSPNSTAAATIEYVDVAISDGNLTSQSEIIVEENIPAATNEICATNNRSDFGDPQHSTVVTKVEQPAYFYNVHSANSASIDDVLDEQEEIIWEKDPDVVNKIGRSGMPKPWLATDGNIIKREGDLMSGDVAFNETVHKNNFSFQFAEN